MIDVDPALLSAKGFSANDVVQALQAANIIIPAGTARIGGSEYNVALNSSPTVVDRFSFLPLGVRNGVPVELGDVAKVSDSFAPQTNIVHVNGTRSPMAAVFSRSPSRRSARRPARHATDRKCRLKSRLRSVQVRTGRKPARAARRWKPSIVYFQESSVWMRSPSAKLMVRPATVTI